MGKWEKQIHMVDEMLNIRICKMRGGLEPT